MSYGVTCGQLLVATDRFCPECGTAADSPTARGRSLTTKSVEPVLRIDESTEVSTSRNDALRNARVFAAAELLSGVLLIAGALMSWAKITAVFVGTVTVAGTDTPRGNDFIILGVVAAILSIGGIVGGGDIAALTGAGAGLVFVLALLWALNTQQDVKQIVSESAADLDSLGVMTTGEGLTILVVGSVIGLVGALGTAVFAYRAP